MSRAMRFLSVCSGIEAASVAWAPLGWEAAAFAEIDPFASAVLAHHYPDTPNLGDMTKFAEWPDLGPIDLVCGGTPCQSFSVAGLRQGLDDPRGDLMLTFGAVAAKYRPRWLVWENVPGVLSSNGGRDFGAFLGLLGQLGYGFAYRILDAQYFGLAQRRQRVFVVACLGDWRRAAAVLFERESLQGHPAPSRSAGARVAVTLTRGADSGGKGGYAGRRQEDDVNIVAGALTGVGPGSGWRMGPDEAAANHCVAGTLTAGMFEGSPGGGDGKDGGLVIAHTLRGEGFDASEDGTGRGTPLVMAFDTTQITSPANRSAPKPGDPCHPLAASAHAPAIAFNARQDPIHGPVNGPLDTDGTTSAVMNGVAVRRITPTEAERLQGFEDGYTAIAYRGKPAADGPRYRALGNSWAVNCARWVGQRIACVDAIAAVELAA